MNILHQFRQTLNGAGRPGQALCHRTTAWLAGAMLAWAWAGFAHAQQAFTLNEVSYSALPGDRIQVRLDLSAAVEEPLSFAIDNPARVALDFPGVSIDLPSKTQNIGIGMARSVTAVEAAGRTRVVLNLVKLVPYELTVQGNAVIVTLESPSVAGAAALSVTAETQAGQGSIHNIDFRRGDDGEGRIIVALSDPGAVVNSGFRNSGADGGRF